MDIEDKVYYRSDDVTVTRSALVIQPYTGRPAWMDWVLGHPGEQTLAMQSVCSIAVSKPSKVRPLVVIGIGVLLTVVIVGIPILVIGALWLFYLLKFGTVVVVTTAAGTGEIDVGGTEQEHIIQAVKRALADRGQEV